MGAGVGKGVGVFVGVRDSVKRGVNGSVGSGWVAVDDAGVTVG